MPPPVFHVVNPTTPPAYATGGTGPGMAAFVSPAAPPPGSSRLSGLSPANFDGLLGHGPKGPKGGQVKQAVPLPTPIAGPGPDVNVSLQTFNILGNPNPINVQRDHTNASIAVNPTNPRNLIAVTTNAVAGTEAYFSFDGGVTWNRRVLGGGGVPDVTFDALGRAYVSFISPLIGPAVARSSDGGNSYAVLAGITESLAAIATGPAPGNPTQQNVYVAGNVGPFVAVEGSVTGGLTFSGTILLDIGTFADVAVGPNGEVYVTYQAGNAVRLATLRFFNGAFAVITVNNVVFMRDQSTAPGVPAEPGGMALKPSIDVDRSNGPNRGRIYITYIDQARNFSVNDYDVFFTYSRDGGNRFTQPVRVNTDLTNATQFNARVAVDQVNGAVTIAWLDTRFGNEAFENVSTWTTASNNGGDTFAPEIEVSDGISGTINDYGIQMGLAVFSNQVYYAWLDNSLFNPPGVFANKDLFFDQAQYNFTNTISPGGTGEVGRLDRFEWNNTSDTATDLGVFPSPNTPLPFTIYGASIFPLGDADWYRWQMGAGGLLCAEARIGQGDLDLRMYAYRNGTLVQISQATHRNSGGTELVQAQVNPGELIYLYVFGFNNGAATDYKVTLYLQ
jgi:hypothetical protein